MKRPTLALCCILKNEIKNLPRLLASIEGCFDEIHLTDTGSTDGSIEWINAYIGANPHVKLHHFTWCDDFAKARNASFEPATADYVMWLDLDDVLTNREAFISWRDGVMALADYWLATYHYASNAAGKPICSFARERAVKRSLGIHWKYFVHEGMIPDSNTKKFVMQYASTWNVTHMRDAEDLLQDRSRNLRLFEKNGVLDARMRYYYGKELFENGKPLEAFGHLVSAIAEDKLELHDRVMGIQYACMAAMQLNQFERAISLAHQGLALSPQRAEFHIIIADSWLKQNRPGDAVPFYEAARKCGYGGDSPIQGPIFQHEDFYRHYPVNQLARIFGNAGDLDRAEGYLREAERLGNHDDTTNIRKELNHVRSCVSGSGKPRQKTDDILISCPPHALYEWDHAVYREKGIGGSETAAVEMSTHLSEITGRRVLIFNPRKEAASFGNVEYRPAKELPEYLRDFEPAAHIGWRHSMKLSEEPMYVWCHDLGTQHMHQHGNYFKAMALTPFHAGYIKNFFGVPNDKIMVTRNGIDPTRFAIRHEKTPGKVVYSSSPDRGLDRAIAVMDLVVKEIPTATLHVYYGFDNMKKMGMHAEVERLEKLMAGKDYIVFHGNLTQKELTKEIASASVWLYPTNFLETFCITALEALCSGVYPVVRRWGGLADTLATAHQEGMCDLLDEEGESPEDHKAYAKAVFLALTEEKWKKVAVNPQDYSWKSVAHEWVNFLGLGEKCLPSSSMPAPMALR